MGSWDVWAHIEKVVASGKPARYADAVEEFRTLQMTVKAATPKEIASQVEHADLCFEFLILFAFNKPAYRSLIVSVLTKLRAQKHWNEDCQRVLKRPYVNGKALKLHKDLQAALGLEKARPSASPEDSPAPAPKARQPAASAASASSGSNSQMWMCIERVVNRSGYAGATSEFVALHDFVKNATVDELGAESNEHVRVAWDFLLNFAACKPALRSRVLETFTTLAATRWLEVLHASEELLRQASCMEDDRAVAVLKIPPPSSTKEAPPSQAMPPTFTVPVAKKVPAGVPTAEVAVPAQMSYSGPFQASAPAQYSVPAQMSYSGPFPAGPFQASTTSSISESGPFQASASPMIAGRADGPDPLATIAPARPVPAGMPVQYAAAPELPQAPLDPLDAFDWRRIEQTVQAERFGNDAALALYRDFRMAVQHATQRQLDGQSRHARRSWEFLLCFAEERALYRNQVADTVRKLAAVPSWRDELQASPAMLAKLQTMHPMLQEAVGQVSGQQAMAPGMAPAVRPYGGLATVQGATFTTDPDDPNAVFELPPLGESQGGSVCKMDSRKKQPKCGCSIM